MTIKLRIISGEDEDFLRDVEISGNSSFLDLHNFIQKTLLFDDTQMASFFITNEEWEKDSEITLMDMAMDESSETAIMSDTPIKQFITENKQRLLYVFDFFNERNLFIETYEINDTDCPEPRCTQSLGNPPQQVDLSDLLGETPDPLTPLDTDDHKDDLLGFSDFDDDIDNDPMISYTDNLEDL
ncbi:plasmid pRiA4b ORF-3 family protein [Labilibacter sediminis]|nr:plasmid pRiA4b ORF-3 family protein [Labilibacter sediminis]